MGSPTTDQSPTDSSPEVAAKAQPTFDDLPLSDAVRRALEDLHYQLPTEVQSELWKPAASGRDVVVQARTGTGKTAAFGLPLIDRLVQVERRAVQALVLCPTRELALQVSRELEALGKHVGVKVAAVYGGASMDRQVSAISDGAHIVAGTPGRVLDHLRRGTLQAEAIRSLVLDESDEMLSMGFERELSAIIEHLPAERQTMLLSATLPPDIARIVRTRLHDPVFVVLSGDHVGALEIDHYIYFVTNDKLGALLSVLETEDPESALVFCNTRERTEQVAHYLQRNGYDADWLNGVLPQNEREKVMRRTRERKLRFLVATDVAARGIDVSHLTHVVNFDFPQDAEGYVHRTGRTGRAGRTGVAVSLVTAHEVGALYLLRLTYKIRPIERTLPSQREERTRAQADIVQSLAETFIPRGREKEHLELARRLLTRDDAETIVAGILHAHLATNPELPELAQSRRRARRPAKQVAPSPPEIAPPLAASAAKPAVATKREKTVAAEPASPEEQDGQHRVRAAKSPAASDGSQAATAADETSHPPSAGDAPRRRRRRRTRQSGDAAPTPVARKSVPRRPAPTAADELPADAIELHVDVGRRAGGGVRLFKALLADGGVGPEQVIGVKVRERYSFVQVLAPAADAAIEALTGATVGEQVVTASISSRSEHADSATRKAAK